MSHQSTTPDFEWPKIFAYPRVLGATETHGQPYLELVQKARVIPEDSDNEDSDEESSDEECSDDDSEADEDGADDGDAGKVAVEGGDARFPQVDGAGSGEVTAALSEEDAQGEAQTELQEYEEPRHPVRLFMQSTVAGKDVGKQRLDDNIVCEFCEHAAKLPQDSKKKPGYIAIVDVRSSKKAGTDGIGSLSGIARPQRGGLTPQDLKLELASKKITMPQTCIKAEGGMSSIATVQAERVLVYLPDMGEPGMKALAECTTSRKRAAVARFFNDHMHFTPAVDVALKTTGFASYFFRLKVSFIAFRWHKQLRKDIRVKPRGAQANPPSRRSWIPPLQSWMNRRPEPVSQTSPRTQSLRRSWTATCLGTQSSDDGDAPRLPCFYETQLSMMLYGFDDRVYDVYGSSDNYYLPKSKYSATAHHNVWKRSKKLNIWDPFSRLSCIVDRPIWESRHYFLYIWAEYIMEASREWEPITRLLKDAVKQRRMAKPITAEDVRELNAWTEEMGRLLDELIEPLSETTKVWEEFERYRLGYFVSDGNMERINLRQQIANSYSELRINLHSLENLRKELRETNRYEVQNHFDNETQSLAIKVLRLSAVGFCLSSFTQVTSMFNMQDGVLPFPATTRSFMLSLSIVILLYVAVCLNVTWDPWAALDFRVADALVAKPAAKTHKAAACPPPTKPQGLDGSTANQRDTAQSTGKQQEVLGITDDIELKEIRPIHRRLVASMSRAQTLVEDVERGGPSK